jgi:hypothetical protein
MSDQIVLVVPYGRRALRLQLPQPVARWLLARLAEALGEPEPKPRRPVRPRRGRPGPARAPARGRGRERGLP